MKMRLSISTAITLFGLILAVGFASVVLTGAFALKELKVGGPLYASIKLGNDLVADILPPPAYVIGDLAYNNVANNGADHRENRDQRRPAHDIQLQFDQQLLLKKRRIHVLRAVRKSHHKHHQDCHVRKTSQIPEYLPAIVCPIRA